MREPGADVSQQQASIFRQRCLTASAVAAVSSDIQQPKTFRAETKQVTTAATLD
jgi:hypothetical protein